MAIYTLFFFWALCYKKKNKCPKRIFFFFFLLYFYIYYLSPLTHPQTHKQVFLWYTYTWKNKTDFKSQKKNFFNITSNVQSTKLEVLYLYYQKKKKQPLYPKPKKTTKKRNNIRNKFKTIMHSKKKTKKQKRQHSVQNIHIQYTYLYYILRFLSLNFLRLFNSFKLTPTCL